MLLVDAANVVGSRPTGWWRDRAGAARSFVARLRRAAAMGQIDPPVTVVLEGKARDGAATGDSQGVTVVHARGSGDDTLIELVAASDLHTDVTLVSADRELGRRARALGADVVGPRWLLDRLEPDGDGGGAA